MDTQVCITESSCCTLKLRQHCKSTLHACMLSHCSHIRLHAAIRTTAWQALPSIGSPGKNTGVGCPCPPLGNLPDTGTELLSLTPQLHWQKGPLPLASPGRPPNQHYHVQIPSAGLHSSQKSPEQVEVTI